MPQSQLIRDVMTHDVLTLEATSTVAEAAQTMKGADIGPIPVVDESGQLQGIVTDRDIVVRAIAEGKDPKSTPIGDICSKDVTVLSPDDGVDDAVKMMRERAVRRFPVVEAGKPVGIISIGDLARQFDTDSALADISSAPPND